MAFLKSPGCPPLSDAPLQEYTSHITVLNLPPSNALSSLASAINRVYAPLLLSGDSNAPEKAKDLLDKLDRNLQDAATSSAGGNEPSDFMNVRAPEDELEFWSGEGGGMRSEGRKEGWSEAIAAYYPPHN